MRKLILFILLCIWAFIAQAQNSYELKYDSVVVGKSNTSKFRINGKFWLPHLTAGLTTDSVLVLRSNRVFKVSRSQFSTGTIGFGNGYLMARYGTWGGFTFSSSTNSIIESNANNDIKYLAGNVFTADTAEHVWVTRVTEQMWLKQDGVLQLRSLKTTGTAPTTYGATDMVIVDARGRISRAAIPSGGGGANLALGTGTSTNQPITNDGGTGITLPSSTTSIAGLQSAADKTKLDGIASGANNYTLPVASSSVLGGVKEGAGILINGAGVISTSGGINLTNTVQTSNYTVQLSDAVIIGEATGGSLTFTLPTAASCTNKMYYFWNFTGSNLAIECNALANEMRNTPSNSNAVTLANGSGIALYSTGSYFYRIF